MDAYDSCPVPYPLTTDNATSEVYMLATAIDIFQQELIHDLNEDGSIIKDEGSSYNPVASLQERRKLLDGLKKKLDDLIRSLTFYGIDGVLVD